MDYEINRGAIRAIVLGDKAEHPIYLDKFTFCMQMHVILELVTDVLNRDADTLSAGKTDNRERAFDTIAEIFKDMGVIRYAGTDI